MYSFRIYFSCETLPSLSQVEMCPCPASGQTASRMHLRQKLPPVVLGEMVLGECQMKPYIWYYFLRLKHPSVGRRLAHLAASCLPE